VPLIPIFMILIGLHTERSTRRQWRTLAVLDGTRSSSASPKRSKTSSSRPWRAAA
jgi:hypothetical protein